MDYISKAEFSILLTKNESLLIIYALILGDILSLSTHIKYLASYNLLLNPGSFYKDYLIFWNTSEITL